ncbi:MAG: cytochrome c peroxidase [Syntrophales bacterium]|nr:cytochrome c peroxidase [Syntrophales bacterium]
MRIRRFFRSRRGLALTKGLAIVLSVVMALPTFMLSPAMAQVGGTVLTPPTPMELPIEVEIELSPAGSLKQAPLWKELIQLLKNPYAPVVRRPSFTGTPLPALNVYPLDYNFLTAQPIRLRTSDGEVSWDQPGPMFDPAENIEYDAFSTPTELRTPIGHLVACPNDPPGYQAATVPAAFCTGKPARSLVVYNPGSNTLIPPHGTVVAVAAFFDGVLHELDPATGNLEPLTELEVPVNEEHFFRPGIVSGLTGRQWSEVLGKALFWDMQVGSDGVQSCGTCHFHAGVDNRTRNQLNPNTLGNDFTLQVKGPNQDVVAADFPFRKLINPDLPSEGGAPNVIQDFNDVMSSMGVSRFKQFVDVLVGAAAFIPGTNPRVLQPDNGTVVDDPIPVMQGLRRIEPRHTPTFHNAAFNLDNFWDGRARFVFNGGSVFGAADPQFHMFVNNGTINGPMHGLPDPSEETMDLPLNQWAGTVPARIKFSSLGSQSVGPPLSDFEMAFAGRNWAKIGKKLLQTGVTPLANQLVDPNDSVLGPYSRQRASIGGAVTAASTGRRGLHLDYATLIERAFQNTLWANRLQHFNGAAAPCDPNTSALNGVLTPAGCDPFDGYKLTIAAGPAQPNNTSQFTQKEANFSLFFALAVQAYESLTISDDTPADQFFDANPFAGHGVGEPGDQAVLFPTLIPDLIDDGLLNGTVGYVNLIPDNPATPEYDGFGPDEVFGFDLFAGANLTAALPPGQTVGQSGRDRNPVHTIITAGGAPVNIKVGSNPFTRSAKCMLCHLGPEQTDHSINIGHGLLKNDAEFEYPSPPRVPDPLNIFGDGQLPAPEPSGSSRVVGGLILSEEVTEGPPQDAVEVEPRNFATLDNPNTPWDDRIISQPGNFAFGDQGIYNIGVRPIANDIGRGGLDAFGWTLSLAALSLKNIGGPAFEPCDGPLDSCVMANFNPSDIGATFEETGGGAFFPGTTYTLQSINPGFERRPMIPLLPAYLAPWVNDLPAGELHPQIDEMAGMVPNTITPPNGGPGIEFPEVLFGADLHCASYNPIIFGFGPPNFGWGAPLQTEGPSVCPQHQSGVSGNFAFPSQGTWPVPNRVLRDGAFKAPGLRNVELTGPFFHTGSFLTLRQVVDFYFRGGDFPVTNAEGRDPHVVDLNNHAFSFGRTTGADLSQQINFTSLNSPTTLYLVGELGFADGLPDGVYLYDEYPDSNHPVTPEPLFASRAAAIEDAKESLVKFLLALTDPRVKYEQAPFDRPQIFVPIDGTAPDNTGGPTQLAAQTGTGLFRQIPAVGAAGNAIPLPAFLGVTNIPPSGLGYNCSSSAGPVSHFCSTVTP